MKIGNVTINNNAFLAPLAGFTDVGFRDIATRYGCELTYTEMVSCKGVYYDSDKTKEILATSPREKIMAAQVFGREPNIMAAAITNAAFDKFAIIDVNMGCPVPKIFKNGEGSWLLNDPEQVLRIITAMTAVTSKPITVKTRLGVRGDDKTQVLELARAAQEAGASAVAVHGRTREQYYTGEADWESIARVREVLNVPLIANGDINSLDSYINCLKVTGADAVMIGRGALGNPQLFMEIAHYNGLTTELNNIDIKRDILAQIDVLRQYYDERYIHTNMKKHLCYYAHGFKNGRTIRDKACRVESLLEMLAVIDEHY